MKLKAPHCVCIDLSALQQHMHDYRERAKSGLKGQDPSIISMMVGSFQPKKLSDHWTIHHCLKLQLEVQNCTLQGTTPVVATCTLKYTDLKK